MNNQVNNQVPVTNKKSGNGLLVFLIIVLLLCCLGLGGYILYSKYFVVKEEVTSDTSETLKQVKIDGESLLQVEDIINTFEYAYNDSFSDYFGYIYNSKEISTDSFDNGAALFACLYPYLDESPNVSYVANNTVKYKFKSLFGSKLTYTPSNVNAGVGYQILYNANTKYYEYQRVGIGSYFYPTYLTFNDSSTVSNEKIEIIKRVAYMEYSDNHLNIDMYTDKTKAKKIGQINVTEGSFNPNEILNKYKSSFAQYKYTFIKEKDNFVFDSIKRTK